MPFISTLYFRTAIVLLITGIVIGIHMSIQGDHSVMGAHAHLNLLGWVTSSLFAIYYALHPAKAAGRLPFLQYAVYMIGLAVMIPSLYVMLKGNPGAEPLVATGSLITSGASDETRVWNTSKSSMPASTIDPAPESSAMNRSRTWLNTVMSSGRKNSTCSHSRRVWPSVSRLIQVEPLLEETSTRKLSSTDPFPSFTYHR